MAPVVLTIGTELTFNKILLEATDDALSSLSESVKESVYYYLEKTFSIKKCEIPYRTDDFSDALEKIFGLGARPLEIMFIKHLHAKIEAACKSQELGCPLSKWIVPQDMTFREYVSFVRGKIEPKNENGNGGLDE